MANPLREQKKTCFRIGIFITLGLLVCSGVFTIYPLMRYNTALLNGTCEIEMIVWQSQWCDEASLENAEYYVPVIVSSFTNLNVSDYRLGITFRGLYIDEHREDKTTDYKATIFDDGSESALIQCEWPNIQQEINYNLAKIIPSLTVNGSGFDDSSFEPSTPTNYTVIEPFPCTHDKWKGVLYLTFGTEPNELLSITFYVALLLHVIMCFLVTRNDDKDMIFNHIAFLSLLPFYFFHGILYMIFCFPLEICGKRGIPDVDDLFKKGSIFFPLVWLVEKLFESCYGCLCTSPSSRPAATEMETQSTRHRTREDYNRQPRLHRTRSRSLSSIDSVTLNPVLFPAEPTDHEPAPPSAPPSAPPPSGSVSVRAFSSSDGPPMYNDVMSDSEGGMPPPPSYDEVMRES